MESLCSRAVGDETELPLDFPRASDQTGASASSWHALCGQASLRMDRPSALRLIAAVQLCLHVYTGSTDIVVGFGGEGIGVDLSDDPTLFEVLSRTEEAARRSDGARPFRVEVRDLSQPSAPCATGCDVSVGLDLSGGSLYLAARYANALFRADTIQRLLAACERALIAMRSMPDHRLSALSLSSAEEIHTLTQVWSRGGDAPIPELTLHQMFEQRVAESPDAVAIIDEDAAHSFACLNARANQLAHHLEGRGVRRGQLVGICLERSPEAVESVLAVLKTGAAYVPLDPANPSERLAHIYADADIACVVTVESMLDRLPDCQGETVLLDLDGQRISCEGIHDLGDRSGPNDLAYVLYTSGSTGVPKGVAVEHRSVTNFSVQTAVAFDITPSDRVLQFASLGFDVSVFELFTPLLAGCPMVIARDVCKRSPRRLTRVMQQHRVSVAELPPALLPMLDPADLPALRLLSVGGEKFSGDLVARWATSSRRMINGYGPTETTVAVTLYDCCGEWATMPPIGRPMVNHRAYVLAPDLRPVPIGGVGELHVAGVGVARGYLNRPEATRDRFVRNPFSDSSRYARLYKTGDLVRWLSDGNLEILGRVDRQIKLRGFRIELGEIETIVAAQDGVSQAVVEAARGQDGSPLLVAFVVGSSLGAAEIKVLHDRLHSALPAHMVPSRIVALDEIPLTANGKVDRRALPVSAGLVPIP